MTKLVDLLAAILTTVMLALSADLFRKAGLSLYTEKYLTGRLHDAGHADPVPVGTGAGAKKADGGGAVARRARCTYSAVAAAYAAVRFPRLSELSCWNDQLSAGRSGGCGEKWSVSLQENDCRDCLTSVRSNLPRPVGCGDSYPTRP